MPRHSVQQQTSYLRKITHVRDELAALGETILDNQLVRTTLSGFTKKWDGFIDGIVAREHLLDWRRV